MRTPAGMTTSGAPVHLGRPALCASSFCTGRPGEPATHEARFEWRDPVAWSLAVAIPGQSFMARRTLSYKCCAACADRIREDVPKLGLDVAVTVERLEAGR